MKSVLALSLALFASVSLSASAFADLGTKATVDSIYKAARKGKLDRLKRELGGKALEAYGNEEGLQKLQQEALVAGKERKLRITGTLESTTGSIKTDDMLRTYSVQVADKKSGEAIRSLTVECEVTEHWVTHGPHGYCGPHGMGNCGGGFDSLEQRESCVATDLN